MRTEAALAEGARHGAARGWLTSPNYRQPVHVSEDRGDLAPPGWPISWIPPERACDEGGQARRGGVVLRQEGCDARASREGAPATAGDEPRQESPSSPRPPASKGLPGWFLALPPVVLAMTFTVDRAYLQPWAWFILPVSGAAAWWLHRRRAGGEETPFLPALAWIVSVFLALGWTIRLVRRLVD